MYSLETFFATLPLPPLPLPSVQHGDKGDLHKRLCSWLLHLQLHRQHLRGLLLCSVRQPGAWLLPHRLLLEPLLLHAHLLPSLPHHDHGQGKSFFFINTNTDKYNLLSLIINTNKASPASLLNQKKTRWAICLSTSGASTKTTKHLGWQYR